MYISHYFEPHSSPIDWCEENYETSYYIAEFFNTLSNAPVIVFVLLYFVPSRNRNALDSSLCTLYTLFAIVAICSAYFHATLSIAGQLLDELSILWSCSFYLAVWYPKWLYPTWLHNDRSRLITIAIIFCFIITPLCFYEPKLNSFCLMLLLCPGLIIFHLNVSSLQDPAVSRATEVVLVTFTIALSCWVLDRFFCDWCLQIGFPYLHSLWHIFMYSGMHYMTMLQYYVTVCNERRIKPILKYWPVDRIGLPYVIVKYAGHQA